MTSERYGWSPQPGPQADLCCCPFPEVFFGGARGGGKTDGVLGKWALKERRYGPHFNAIMFRRTTVSAEDAIERSSEIYGPLGGNFNEAKLRWRMPNGGRVAFRYLENIKDADEYQGRNVTDAWIEEAGQYPPPPRKNELSPAIARLFGVLRSAQGVPIQLVLTANPGGAGQNWIRDRYELHPFPRRPKVLRRLLPTGEEHRVAVIPSRITDNRILLASDPGYISRLHLVGSPQLVKAWLEGDWSAIEGAFFSEWSNEKHVISPFVVPDTWLRFRSGDWGSYSPFSIGWWAVVGDDFAIPSGAVWTDEREPAERLDFGGDRERTLRSRDSDAQLQADGGAGSEDFVSRTGAALSGMASISGGEARRVAILPRGALIRYREWYGEVGGKLTAEQVGQGIIERERDDRAKLAYGVLDPSAFLESGGPSIAERLNNELIRAKLAPFHEADNRRVARNVGDPQKAGPMGGWDQVRARLIGRAGVPMIYFFETCTDSIRTIPVLQHDEKRAEDLDTDAEDHAADDVRYACMSRPWIKKIPEPERPKDGYRPPAEEVDAGDSILLL